MEKNSGLWVWEQQDPVWLIWPALAGRKNLGEWGIPFIRCNANEGFALFNTIWLMDKLNSIWYLAACNECIKQIFQALHILLRQFRILFLKNLIFAFFLQYNFFYKTNLNLNILVFSNKIFRNDILNFLDPLPWVIC